MSLYQFVTNFFIIAKLVILSQKQVIFSGNYCNSGKKLQEGQVNPFFSPIEQSSDRLFMLILFAKIRSSYTGFSELA